MKVECLVIWTHIKMAINSQYFFKFNNFNFNLMKKKKNTENNLINKKYIRRKKIELWLFPLVHASF